MRKYIDMEEVDFTKFKKTLKNYNCFVTKPRLRLFALLHRHNPVTIKELIGLAQKNDQSTIYRNIELFEKLGIVQNIRLGWHTKLELTDKFQKHHHHLICTNCEQLQSIPEHQTIEELIQKTAQTNRYIIKSHQLEIYGLCQNCQVSISNRLN